MWGSNRSKGDYFSIKFLRSCQQLLTYSPGLHQLLDKRLKNLRKLFCPHATFLKMREIEIERLHVDPSPGSQSQRVLYPGSINERTGSRGFLSCGFSKMSQVDKGFRKFFGRLSSRWFSWKKFGAQIPEFFLHGKQLETPARGEGVRSRQF